MSASSCERRLAGRVGGRDSRRQRSFPLEASRSGEYDGYLSFDKTMAMTKTQVLALLKENRNERGIANWKKRGIKNSKLKSFGVGLTQLRKLAKQVGRDHNLALQLWKSDIYDAKVIGLLIDDPKQLSREHVEEQVEGLQGGNLAHVFASCGATLAKTPFAFELTCD